MPEISPIALLGIIIAVLGVIAIIFVDIEVRGKLEERSSGEREEFFDEY